MCSQGHIKYDIELKEKRGRTTIRWGKDAWKNQFGKNRSLAQRFEEIERKIRYYAWVCILFLEDQRNGWHENLGTIETLGTISIVFDLIFTQKSLWLGRF